LLKKNERINPADIYRELRREKIEITQEGVRKAIKEMENLLDIEEEIISNKRIFYKVRPKDDKQTFFKLFTLFIHLQEIENFIKTKYCADNLKYLFKYEKILEEMMVDLKKEFDELLEEMDEVLANFDEFTDPTHIFNFIDKVIVLMHHWNNLEYVWDTIENICEGCRRKKRCLKSKIKKYGDVLTPELLEAYKNLEIPGGIVSNYCYTMASNLYMLKGRMDNLIFEFELSGFKFKKLINFDNLNRLIIKYLEKN